MVELAHREGFWRDTNYLRHIKNIRNRTGRLVVNVGVPRLAGRIVAGWYETWTGHSDDDVVRAREIVAEHLEPAAAHLTVALLDDGQLAAGSTNFIHRGELVAGVSYLAREYRRLGAGIRLIDVMFDIAAERGYGAFDLGGQADYKAKWAPQDGMRARFAVAKLHVRAARKLAAAVRSLPASVRRSRADTD